MAVCCVLHFVLIPISITSTMKSLELVLFFPTLFMVVSMAEMRFVESSSQSPLEFQSETTSQTPFEFEIETVSPDPYQLQVESTSTQNSYDLHSESTSQIPFELEFSESTSLKPLEPSSESPLDFELESELALETMEVDTTSEAYLPAYLDDPADYWNTPVLIGNTSFEFLSNDIGEH